MAYRVSFTVNSRAVEQLRELGLKADRAVEPIMRDSTRKVKEYAVQNLSGVPFTSKTGTHIINKNTGKAAASLQIQFPYGSPYRARLFAYQGTRYGDNPETYNYLDILERGRGEVRPKYTKAMRDGHPEKARLVIPGGDDELVYGQKGFRGITGRYRFVKSLPAMEGKYWMEAASQAAQPHVREIAAKHLGALLNES